MQAARSSVQAPRSGSVLDLAAVKYLAPSLGLNAAASVARVTCSPRSSLGHGGPRRLAATSHCSWSPRSPSGPSTRPSRFGVVADHVGLHPGAPHQWQQAPSLLPLMALIASADRGVVADHVRLKPGAPHLRQDAQGLRPLLALLTDADRDWTARSSARVQLSK